MSYEPSPRGAELRDNLLEFMETSVYPAEEVYEEQMDALLPRRLLQTILPVVLRLWPWVPRRLAHSNSNRPPQC